MQMTGVDPATMGRILGHKDIETTMIYVHQTQEHLKKSIEKIGIWNSVKKVKCRPSNPLAQFLRFPLYSTGESQCRLGLCVISRL